MSLEILYIEPPFKTNLYRSIIKDREYQQEIKSVLKIHYRNNINSSKGNKFMYDKKPVAYTSPDLSKMQAVVIDIKTTIYIALDADPKLARSTYLSRMGMKKV